MASRILAEDLYFQLQHNYTFVVHTCSEQRMLVAHFYCPTVNYTLSIYLLISPLTLQSSDSVRLCTCSSCGLVAIITIFHSLSGERQAAAVMASQSERETSLANPSIDGPENSENLKKAVENHVSKVTLSTSNGSNETPTAGGRANSTENVTDRDGEVETRSSSGPVSQEGAATEEQRANSAGSTHKDSSETPSSESSETIPPFQPRSSTQYQLVFGMDEESSETSITSSPRSSECPTNPLPTLPPPGVQDLIAGNLSHDLFSESQDGDDELLDTTLVEDPSGGDRDGGTGTHDSSGGSSSRVPGRESLSVYSSSTMVKESPVSAARGKQEASNSDDKLEHLEQSAEESKSLEPKVKEGKPPEEEEEGGESQRSVDDDVKLEDIRLRTRSESETPPPRPKIHPLSQDTSDSEEDTALPPYSPVEYVPDESEDMEMGNVGPSPLPPGMESPLLLEDQPSMSILFSGLTYLGSSSVDAPISEPEANRKMLILKQQAATSEPIPVVLSIPVSNDGIVYMNDPNTDQPLATFAVKNILFCARGSAEDMHDCFCLNVRHKRSGIYHCHVFRCRIMEAVSCVCVCVCACVCPVHTCSPIFMTSRSSSSN